MLDPLLPEYDFLIIGGGPAGLLAALTLSSAGIKHRIALIDKRDPWREPVSCAEAVSKRGLESLVPKVDAEWVRDPIDGVFFVAPDGTRVEFEKKDSGLLINRALMHKRLAEESQRRGVHCNFRARATRLSRLENGFRTVTYEGEPAGQIRAKVVLDCSGPGLGFGQGENITQGNFDVEPALFALIEGLEYPVNYIQLYFGHNYAPGGYAWLFPRDEHMANVGLVVGRDYAKHAPARQAMKHFIETTYPGARVTSFQGGAIPCGFPDEPLAVDNLYKAGDAANMVNPISRAGILEAMTGGKFAAEAALKTISISDEKDRLIHYAEYKARWEKAYGNSSRRIGKAKKAFMSIPDSVLNKAAHSLVKIPPHKRTLARIFLATMWNSPSLLWKMRGLFSVN